MDILTITVLSASALISFLIAAFCGRFVIPMLHKMKFGQTIRDIGPVWHKKKQGTPTMGGILFIGATVLTFAGAVTVCEFFLGIKLFSATPLTLTRLFGGVMMAVMCGALGFADDYIKVVKKRNLGLTARQKLFGQLLVALGYAISLYMADGTAINIPFIGYKQIGLWFIPFCMFVILCMTNAVNLTDGIDGLCGTVSFVATLFFIVAAGVTGYIGQSIFAAPAAGALAGFLVWNLYPAKVIMGDTGALFIGGMLTALAFGINQPFLLVPVSIVYIIEMLSVVLQVLYFKATKGRRLFKMSPLHHHFEMSGWSENKIVFAFSLITIMGCIAAFALLLYA
ncbi:MAG: phospho-N-acetylmuramoyl-pentapeptide-transferase [Oscillospiraceae bacterium]|nr:phospho-N-acetylmuramoyl-pentapeptide-transferase [Oscillospiraceae bacterium]